MKRLILAAMLILAAQARGADVVITNYFTGYVLVPSTCTNAGATGLSVSNAYACFPVTPLQYVTEALAAGTTNGDVRALMYALVEHYYQGLSTNTNAPENQTIERGLAIQSNSTNIDSVVRHAITTKRRINTSSLVPED
jgi:hypothetical protein